MVEKLNHTLVSAIKKLSVTHSSDWDTHLNTVLYAYRVRAHEALGISPFELLYYGVVPIDAEQDPLLAFGKSQGFDQLLALPKIRNEVIIKDAQAGSLSPSLDFLKFLPGTPVLHKNFNRQTKLDVHWVDKFYIVVSAFNNNTYLIADVKTGKLLKRRINSTHLRKYFTRGDDRNLPVKG